VSIVLAVAAVRAWLRERHLPSLQRSDAAFGRGMASVVAGMLFLLAAGVTVGVENQRVQAARFMEECVQHRPRYECVLLWRQSEPPDYPMPIKIIIPMPLGSR
jgi:hypothetical protein